MLLGSNQLRFRHFSLCTFQALTEVATMAARALYTQAGGAQTRLSSINADPQIVRLLDFFKGLVEYVSNYPMYTFTILLYLPFPNSAFSFE